jgi:hypothetical protein
VSEAKYLRTAARLANIFLLSLAVVCVLVTVYFAYYHGLAGQRQFTSWRGPVAYYVLPTVIAIFLFATLRLKSDYRAIIAICCLAVAVSAYGGELYLQVSDSTISVRRIMSIPSEERKDKGANFVRRYGLSIDIRDRHEVIADLRKQGIEAVPQVLLPVRLEKQPDNRKWSTNTRGVEIMPLGGIANKTTVACNQSGQYLTYETDEHGFHNPKGIWQSRHIDIAAVGNSFTLGYCVPSDKNFVTLIRGRYPATLNLGMPGKGPVQVLATIKEYALLLKPKLVLWFYAEGSSLLELQYEKQSRILMGYLRGDFSQGLLGRQSDIDQAFTSEIDRQTALELTSEARTQEKRGKRVDQLLEFIKLGQLRRKLGVNYGETRPEPEELSELELSQLEVDLNLLRNILSEAKVQVEAWGGKLYFVYLPSWARYAQRTGIEVKARTRTLSLVSTLGIPMIDATAAFQAQRDPLSLFPFRGPGHYNQEGHRVVAETVLNVISQRHPNDFNPQTQPVRER